VKVRYDDQEVELEQRLVVALQEVMRATCEMMRAAEPENADCWEWGRCEVRDLASAKPFFFQYGCHRDEPRTDGLGDFAVIRGEP
jgi:hypothetical protein